MLGLEYSNQSYYDKKGKFRHKISFVNYDHFSKALKRKKELGLIK